MYFTISLLQSFHEPNPSTRRPRLLALTLLFSFRGFCSFKFTQKWASIASKWFGEELGRDSEESLRMGRLGRSEPGVFEEERRELGWERREKTEVIWEEKEDGRS